MNCNHCHGPYGSGYGPTFYARTDLKALKQEVGAMCEGPGQNPLKGADLDALTDFHRALIAKIPFIDITVRKTNHLEGEVYPPNAKVTLGSGDNRIPVTVDDGDWSIDFEPGQTGPKSTLTASASIGKASLTIGTESWSVPIVKKVKNPGSIPQSTSSQYN